MCGICGIVSHEPIGELLLTAIEKIQYRGYDSAGIGLVLPNEEIVIRKQGLSDIDKKVDYFLSEIRNDKSFFQSLQQAHLGIGHTRWATHGSPNDVNAHPHYVNNGDDDCAVLVVHNGINNNHEQLVNHLGHEAISDTDSERIGALISQLYDSDSSLLKATIGALNSGFITGQNAIVLASPREENKIVAAQINGRPLYIGVKEDVAFVCSDIPTLVMLDFRNQLPLNPGEVIELTPGRYEIYDLNGNPVFREPTYNSMSIDLATKGGYQHFMLAEIASQGKVLRDAQILNYGVVEEVMDRFVNAILNADRRGNKIYLLGNGSSLYAAMFGSNLLRSLDVISEPVAGTDITRYPLRKEDVILAFSQSGETDDIIKSSYFAKERGAEIFSLVNVVGSSLTRIAGNEEIDNNMYLNCGPEICVVATKSFLSQLYRLIDIYELTARKMGKTNKIIHGMKDNLPDVVQETIDMYLDGNKMSDIIELVNGSRSVIYMGLENSYPISLEGALKLNETTYTPSLGILASQLKHGSIALFDPKNPENIPLISVISYDGEDTYRTMESNIREAQARNAIVASVVRDRRYGVIKKLSNYTIPIPDIPSPYCYLPAVVPLQLLAYHVALKKGCDIDQPRNLAKSVTVE